MPNTLQEIHKQSAVTSLALWRKSVQHIYWFAASLALSLIVGALFLRYATSRHKISASLLLRDDSRGSEFGDAALEDLGIATVKTSVDNELEILRSRTLIEHVVDALQLNVQYFASGRVKTAEIFDKSPFRVTVLQARNVQGQSRFDLTFLSDNQYVITTKGKSRRACFGDTIKLSGNEIIITKTNYQAAHDDRYFFTISEKEVACRQYAANLNVAATNKLASLVNLSLTDILPKRGEAVLSKLIDVYLQTSQNDKKQIADSTIAFIEQNLADLSIELTHIERDIQDFRSENRITDLSEDRRSLLTQFSELSKARQQQFTQLRLVENLEIYLRDYPDQVVPSSFFQHEIAFLDIAKQYNEMQLVRKKQLVYTSDAHPIVLSVDSQLNALRTDLLVGILSQKKDLLAQMDQQRRVTRVLNLEIRQLPRKERILRERLRDQEIKQDLYVFLLKKRLETSISRSSTFSSARVIDEPKADANPGFPNPELIMLVSGIIGVGVPLLLTYAQLLFNQKLDSREQIAESCSVPVVSEISLTREVRNNYRFEPGLTAEQFRILRTNIQFLLPKEGCKTIMLTSNVGGEGKSFIASHLAASVALTGKQVILVEMDLRKPSLSGALCLGNHGIADMLLADKKLENYIQQVADFDFFHVLLAGAPLVNPAEILASGKITKLLEELKQTYDYIIIDTPPVGLVADARLISPHTDLCLFIVRLNTTRKSQLEFINQAFQNQHFNRLHLIINGTKPVGDYRYNYGYQPSPPGKLRSILNFLKQTKNRS